jgi:hypothetical protein
VTREACSAGRERGSALVIVVFAVWMAVMVGTIAVTNTVQALTNTDHQQNVKRAQQAADAAIDAAIYGLNRLALVESLNIDPLDPGTVLDQNCVVGLSGGAALDLVALPAGSTWCPETTGDMGDGTTWSYRVSQVARIGNGNCGESAALSLDRRIVAVGVSHGTERRVAATLRAPVSLFSGAAVQSGATSTPLTMSGTARVTGNVHANAAITSGGGAPVITGNATAGPGGSVSVVPAGITGVSCHLFSLPPVAQGGVPTTNANASLDVSDAQSGDCVDHALGLLPVLCDPPIFAKTGGFDWTPAQDQRTLRVWGNGIFRLPPGDYSFCRIRLEGQGILLVPPGATDTRVFLDSPENCAGVANAGTITSDGLSRIVNCHAQTDPGSLQLYAVGSTATATTQTFSGGGALTGALMNTLCGSNIPLVGTPMMVYAPNSQVTLAGNAAIAGQVAAKVVSMSGASSVTSVSSLVNLNELGSNPVIPVYKPQDYISCTSYTFAELSATNPAVGC